MLLHHKQLEILRSRSRWQEGPLRLFSMKVSLSLISSVIFHLMDWRRTRRGAQDSQGELSLTRSDEKTDSRPSWRLTHVTHLIRSWRISRTVLSRLKFS